MVSRLEATKDTTCVFEKLEGLGYDVYIQSNKIAFIYRKGTNSNILRSDVKSAKESCKYNGTIKSLYGTNNLSL